MDLLTIIGGALAGVASLVLALVLNRLIGRSEARTEALKDAVKRTEQGRASVRDGRASGDSPVDRVRRNDGQW